MIGAILLVLVIALVAGAAGLWFGIVILAPRFQRRIDRADATEPDKEPDGPAD